ncbi:hypothetical protein [Glutamicibacter nicotianae]|uniref:AbiEi antitoxin C-terminal domain-containing protein n=1 Tax=Glutamicibacter nicotianae TaxID=37929 RepID=A0ABQ0RGK5_GLUNI|nr:hypothetical protein [Glutamicibacter nicotianae]GEC10928.1 hypothetical protein ANI01nite_01310 [Glutamicibacter nicotianae]
METRNSAATGPRAAALRIPGDLWIAGEMFTRNELDAMASNGLLREVLGDYFLPSSIQVNASVRARIAGFACGRELDRDAVLARQTAAWIHGLLPSVFTLCIYTKNYHRPFYPGHGLKAEFAQMQVPDTQMVFRSRLKVTTALRSACDCAKYDPLPIASRVLGTVISLADPYLNLDLIRQALDSEDPSPERSRALRLVQSFSGTAQAA